MQQYVEEYSKFQNYLERVVNETGELQSINEIFNRYETLIEVRQVLSNQQDDNLRLLEERGTEIVKSILVVYQSNLRYYVDSNINSCKIAFNCLLKLFYRSLTDRITIFEKRFRIRNIVFHHFLPR